jgi:uncharacterized protein
MDMAQNAARVAAGAVDLDAPERLLESDATPAFSMVLSELDGFLTGIAAGPGAIEPDEFLRVVWGGEEGIVQDTDPVVTLILMRLEEIQSALRVGPQALSPVFWEREDGSEDAGDWANGFMHAIDLRLDEWEPLFQNRRAQPLLSPILLLATDMDGKPFLPLEAEDDEPSDEEIAKITTMIPFSAAAIHDFWEVEALRGDVVWPMVREVKPGRNEPCSCGSGKKYKKCCGGSGFVPLVG